MYESCLQLFWKIDLVNKAKNYIFPKEQNMINQLKDKIHFTSRYSKIASNSNVIRGK